MPGWIAKAIMHYLLKNKRQADHYEPRDYAAARKEMDLNSAKVPLPQGMCKRCSTLGGVPVVWFTHQYVSTKKIVLYIHGGGFNTGSAIASHTTPVAICKKDGFAVVSVDYRLAPEHPYPAALEDCAAVYMALLEQGYQGCDIAIAGDSAGGNLVFALTHYLKDRGIPLPAAICGISPVAVLDNTLPSRTERLHRDPMISGDFAEEMQITYIREHDVNHPYLSPGYGDFADFPPIWMCVGTEEVFYDDAFLLYKKAIAVNVPVELIVGKGLCHVYTNLPDRQSRETIRSLRDFLTTHLTQDKTEELL